WKALDDGDDANEKLSLELRFWVWWFNTAYPVYGYGVSKSVVSDQSFRAHCDMLLNNICEVFNRQLMDGRDVPIITCLEFVREYLMKRIVKVQQVINKSKGPLTPATAVLFKSITYQASFYKFNRLVIGCFSIKKVGLTGMPCKHVVAALWDRARNKSDAGIPESWVHACYCLVTWKKVYSYKINPLNGKDL
ncbi:hypothetical protein Tco_1126548, partial [Tanacetum coccineum]